ncbi:MAG TPA: cob(I)yrinic acid a,c-diamide adenosyltransferase [Pusillimonas sp.]|jgi:cob(I)alamin adenosyltransferase|nr:ATP:cob(I)alamin adenosyltransferase [Pusillimonas sp.]MBC41702.1 ATP:cob(I)alamin adenosyltransferase [Pusillimonas sp.]HBT33875.1 cob(I)yrinic acid a,c-diamide adenosyltransferase [Pusillimonas sp.]HCP77004.1 cob(I)yrinic acid a,c-diamide adenosyltransferase [Pusillimonas sp.]|tara:strand:- start:261000 stop:261542 length:543 start_codon:yes stop_codon:yes gene_type:complete
MANRLSVIATRTGDDGTTALGDGTRIEKHAPRVQAMGDVDELNSMIGLWRAEPLSEEIDVLLEQIQHDLFSVGAELCLPGYTGIQTEQISQLDQALKKFNTTLRPLKEFVLPGGTRATALAHLTRTVCRRAERSVISLSQHEAVSEAVKQYLNRLSDLCFVLARILNDKEAMWRNPGKGS